MKLSKRYENVVSEYIELFCKKHELDFECWVGGNIGGIACFGDVFYFSFQVIVWDINTNQKKGLIIQWLYESIDNYEKSINYYSYTKGLRYE